MAEWRRLAPDISNRFQAAMASGLLSAAYVYYNEIKRRLVGGYTSGAFVVDMPNWVTIAPPAIEGGQMAAYVGTYLRYPLYWELGHNNIFTRRFERQERWFPAAIDTQEAQHAAFLQAFGAGLERPALGNGLEFNLPAGTLQGPNLPPGTESRPFGNRYRRGGRR